LRLVPSTFRASRLDEYKPLPVKRKKTCPVCKGAIFVHLDTAKYGGCGFSFCARCGGNGYIFVAR
jgi:DnaJ-class molecular chaperone